MLWFRAGPPRGTHTLRRQLVLLSESLNFVDDVLLHLRGPLNHVIEPLRPPRKTV
jgi:hypothetical protein